MTGLLAWRLILQGAAAFSPPSKEREAFHYPAGKKRGLEENDSQNATTNKLDADVRGGGTIELCPLFPPHFLVYSRLNIF